MALPFSREARWVFIGDSITDCSQRTCPERLGQGYVRSIRDLLYAAHPAFAPTVINRGISANKITDLQARWDEDVLAHQPDLVSVKIGINDVWHGLGDNPAGGTSLEKFHEGYADILERTQKAFPSVTIVLCEPSVIWPPSPSEGNEKLQPYVQAVREVAEKFGARCVVPLHHAFLRSREARPDIDWAPDGVHPSSAGHMLIARTWLGMLGLL